MGSDEFIKISTNIFLKAIRDMAIRRKAEIEAREAEILQRLAAIDGRFTSLNKIPVEKASVPRDEWVALRRAVLDLLHGPA